MMIVKSVMVTGQGTFGRDGAMFESLLGFVAQLSVVLWSLVILTAVVRFVGIRAYRHTTVIEVPVTAEVSSAAVQMACARSAPVRPAEAATNANFVEVLKPSEVSVAMGAPSHYAGLVSNHRRI